MKKSKKIEIKNQAKVEQKSTVSVDVRAEGNVGEFYNVNESAMDSLINAESQVKEEELQAKQTPKLKGKEVYNEISSQKQRDPYKIDKLGKLPAWLVAIFAKYWFCGAVCFFFLFGIGITDSIDMSFVLGITMGIVTDILVNNAFRAFQNDRKNYNAFMMFPPKKFWTFFANIVYALVVAFCVMFTYQIINMAIISANGLPPTAVPFGAEPFGYSAIYLAWDMLFIGIKDLIVSIIIKSNAKKIV